MSGAAAAHPAAGEPTAAKAGGRDAERVGEKKEARQTDEIKNPAAIHEPLVQPQPVAKAHPSQALGPHKKPVTIAVVGLLKGTGKTMLARHLAHQTQIAGAGPSVIVEVGHATESRADGAVRRGEDATAPIFQSSFDRLASDLEELRSGHLAHIFVDASPSTEADLDRVVAAVDAVVIPTRPVEQQVAAVGPVVASAERHRRAFVMVINGAAKGNSANARIAMALAQHGVVCPVIIPRSDAFKDAAAGNRTAMEIDAQGPEAGCVARLWDYLARRLAPKVEVETEPPAEEIAHRERRRFPRWDLRWPVKVTGDGSAFETTICNISGGGALLEGAGRLSMGQWVRLEIADLDTFEAEVVHAKDGMAGLKFLLEGARQYHLAERLALVVEQAKTAPPRRLDAGDLAQSA